MKKTTRNLLIVGTAATLITGTLFAASYLNWTGHDSMTEANIFIEQVSKKLVNQNNKIKDLKAEVAELEKELEDATNNGGGSGSGSVEDLKNQIIEKNNEIAHLTRELERANAKAAEQKTILDKVKAELETEGINIYNMYE